ncbi:MAG: hypothetical protein HYZ57_10995 [Acidobacteria bacterium]|nr:hypothetical protein [Acidobacteriota bacterium]
MIAVDTNLLIYAHRQGLPEHRGARPHDFLRSLIVGAGASVWLPQPGFWERLARAAADLKVPGARIFDLQIALIAFENGAGEIWTHAARFSALPGLLVRDPL